MEVTKDNSKILIILMGSLGDVLRGLSLLKPLKSAERKFEITWLVDSRWQSLLQGHLLIDHLLVVDRPINLKNLRSLIAKLRENNFDYVFDLQRIFKSGLLSFLTKGTRKLSFNRKNSKEYNYLFNHEELPYFPETFPKIDHYHQFLRQIGVVTNEPYQFELDYLLPELPKDFQTEGYTIGLVLESSWESKDWFLASYQELVSLLLNKTNWNLVLLGTKKSSEWSDAILQIANSSRVISLVAKTNLKQLAAVIAKVDLAVGPDSGPGHLASAMGTKYITIFGPTAPDRVAPYGARALAIEAELICRPCYKKSCPGFQKACLRLVTPKLVFAKLLSESLSDSQPRFTATSDKC